jgi:hypothetical protein
LIPNDQVFVLSGRVAPLDFFRRSGIHINGERLQDKKVILDANRAVIGLPRRGDI